MAKRRYRVQFDNPKSTHARATPAAPTPEGNVAQYCRVRGRQSVRGISCAAAVMGTNIDHQATSAQMECSPDQTTEDAFLFAVEIKADAIEQAVYISMRLKLHFAC